MSSGRARQNDLVRATTATVRALSQHADAAVEFDEDATARSASQVTLRPLPPRPGADDIAKLRGEADSFALRLRYHDEEMHAAYRPRTDAARAIFDALERVRCDALGARRMAGVGVNLSALLAERHCGRRRTVVRPPADAPPADVAAVFAWDALGCLPLPPEARHVIKYWRPRLDPAIGDRLPVLVRMIAEQEDFARTTREMIADLGLEPAGVAGRRRRSDLPDDSPQADGGGTERDASATGAKSKDFVKTTPQSSEAGQEDADAGARAGGHPDTLTEGGGEDPGGPTKKRGGGIAGTEDIGSFQIAYTTEFDEIVFAENLCAAEDLRRFRRELDVECARALRSTGRLASRLQRAVMAQSRLGWETCTDEGFLDTARLAGVITNPAHPLAYKLRKRIGFMDTIVALLIDNSGSMKGDPIRLAAVTADVVAQTLERCGVQVEILGFTTRAWKGGQTYEQWRRDGMPKKPGRLNDLRHVIYKAADVPWRRARRNLGLMLNEDVLKENVDGEALMWAHQRLVRRPEARRILVVLSDGEPVDNITVQANSEEFLPRHLRKVADWILTRSPVELLAIGIEHDVGRYYADAITIEDKSRLCPVLLEELAALFEGRTRPVPALAEPEREEPPEKPDIILPELMMPGDLDRRRPRASYFY